jgi:hypothetical protein
MDAKERFQEASTMFICLGSFDSGIPSGGMVNAMNAGPGEVTAICSGICSCASGFKSLRRELGRVQLLDPIAEIAFTNS